VSSIIFEPIAAKMKSGEFHWEVFRKTDLQVRDFGNVVVVIGALSLKSNMHWTGKDWQPSEHNKDSSPWCKSRFVNQNF
jgi:hypothetical protein